MRKGNFFANAYLRGTFVELFDIMNHLLTGTMHTLELTDNHNDITGPHDTWH